MGLDLPLVDAARIAVVGVARLAEVVDERLLAPVPQVGPRADAQPVHPFGRDLADAEEALDGECRDELLDLGRGNREEPVGLAVVRGDFRQHLVHRDARRGGQSGLGADGCLDFARHERRRAVVRDVEKGLVEREGLDQFGVAVEDGANLLRDLLVDLEAGRDENQRGAESPRHGRG